MGWAKNKQNFKTGRTIGQQRERLETASERQAAHKKSQRRRRTRLIIVSTVFVIVAIILVALYFFFFKSEQTPLARFTSEKTYTPTIQIIDEDSAVAGTKTELSERTKNFVGQAEADFKDLGYTPERAVIPTGAIREVDFYLKDQPGFIKFHLDRGTAESVEDADRLLRYLAAQGTTSFEYLDVRLPGKAYWK